jgi:hypothetical protein
VLVQPAREKAVRHLRRSARVLPDADAAVSAPVARPRTRPEGLLAAWAGKSAVVDHGGHAHKPPDHHYLARYWRDDKAEQEPHSERTPHDRGAPSEATPGRNVFRRAQSRVLRRGRCSPRENPHRGYEHAADDGKELHRRVRHDGNLPRGGVA